MQKVHFDAAQSLSIKYYADPDKRGSYILFARLECDGEELISRIYYRGIVRLGRQAPNPTLAQIAVKVGWERNPEELIEEGWEGEASSSGRD